MLQAFRKFNIHVFHNDFFLWREYDLAVNLSQLKRLKRRHHFSATKTSPHLPALPHAIVSSLCRYNRSWQMGPSAINILPACDFSRKLAEVTQLTSSTQ